MLSFLHYTTIQLEIGIISITSHMQLLCLLEIIHKRDNRITKKR